MKSLRKPFELVQNGSNLPEEQIAKSILFAQKLG